MKLKAISIRRVRYSIATLILVMALSSCLSEAKEKLKRAKQGISDVTAIAESAQQAKEDIEILKDAVPLTNQELKEWLPQSLDGWERTSLGVGKTGYINVASIEGGFTNEIEWENEKGESETIKQKFSVSIVDGAGPTGSIMIAGLGMAGKMDMEEENEYKHSKSLEVKGIKAQQTFHKKRNETALQFVYKKRFGIMVNSVKMNPEETWAMLEKLDLDRLNEMAR
ncbi:MAG: hypothetical protein HKN31_06660 [Pricia sp.]|nr:hypothetical protein [Pricia sp.]